MTHIAVHRSVVETPDHEVAGFLRETIGPKLTAYVVDKDPKTVQRWASEENHPSEESVRLMRDLYQVVKTLLDEESRHTVRAWLIGMNPHLDDQAPAARLRHGDGQRVLGAARAFLAGG